GEPASVVQPFQFDRAARPTRGLGRAGPGTSPSACTTGDVAALWEKAATDGSGGAIVRELHGGWNAGTLVPIGQLATSMAVTVRIAGQRSYRRCIRQVDSACR